MNRRFVLTQNTEEAYTRRALFAVEVLDGVTLRRLNDGITVTARGLRRAPIINTGGMFVWRDEELAGLEAISVDPGTLPYEPREVVRADLRLPPLTNPSTPIELVPRVDYDFPTGITGLRGTLVEDRAAPLVPVRDAEVRLRWLDDDGVTWRDAATRSRTNVRGDFVSILRLAATEVPRIDATGAVTVRLLAGREGMTERSSTDMKLVQGRVADPTALDAKTFAWDELQP